MDRPTTLPDAAACPKCEGRFVVLARTVTRAWQSNSTDELEWGCAQCGYQEVEARSKQNGDWPVSKFTHERRKQ